jgi:hypothetical protein
MTDHKAVRPGEEKRGGYSGGKPLSQLKPPARGASAQARPARIPAAKRDVKPR